MIEMRVRQQHVADRPHLVQRQVAHAGAGVDEHVPVDQEDVVRQSFAIAPEQPSTRTFM